MTIKLDGATVYHGNNLDVLPTLPDNSVDAIVTDPPYELGFMGKKWDSSGIAYNVDLWRECLRVLKPGGHLLSFGGTRTWHRVAVAIEDAGFEVRDSMAWLYGSGFPKSLDVSKAIDKAAGAKREVIGKSNRHGGGTMQGHSFQVSPEIPDITAPATDEAKKWAGWGTALKPAFEPIVVARKPLIGTVAENVLTYGTGGLNIDGSRIGIDSDERKVIDKRSGSGNAADGWGHVGNRENGETFTSHAQGRWPANIILDEYTAEILDEQSGLVKGGTWNNTAGARHFNNNGEPTGYETKGSDKSVGGASRFFYVAKASKKDRNEGLDDLEAQRHSDRVSADGVGGDNPRNRTNQAKQNFHPTVKPTSLMRYLVKLVTPPGGTVLDPFTGSGSTGKAAILEGFEFIGIEMTEEYLPIIEGRLTHAIEQASKEKESETLF